MIDRLQEKDIDQVAQIEAEIFSVPWSIKSFKDALASEQNIYLKAETDGQIAGYDSGADICLPKPFKAELLASIVENNLDFF